MTRRVIDGALSTLLPALSFFGALLLALCALVFSLCSFAEAQQAGKIARIVYLSPGTYSGNAVDLEAFRQEMSKLGWIEGKNLTIEYRFEEEKLERRPELAVELLRLKPDAIVAMSTARSLAAQQATKTIPIVMATSDPVGSGLVTSLAQPGGNITGVRTLSAELGGKRLEILKESIPRLSRVAVLWRPTAPGNQAQMKEIEIAARLLELQLQPVGVKEHGDLDNAFSAMSKASAGALMTLGGPWFTTHRAQIVHLVAESRLPAIHPHAAFVEVGGLMAYGINRSDQFRRVAHYVDKILKGAKPAQLPVEQPAKFEFVINLKTAKALDLTIPPAVLMEADKVIK
jgi:putative ABC transport system substrate-binding protein